MIFLGPCFSLVPVPCLHVVHIWLGFVSWPATEICCCATPSLLPPPLPFTSTSFVLTYSASSVSPASQAADFPWFPSHSDLWLPSSPPLQHRAVAVALPCFLPRRGGGLWVSMVVVPVQSGPRAATHHLSALQLCCCRLRKSHTSLHLSPLFNSCFLTEKPQFSSCCKPNELAITVL